MAAAGEQEYEKEAERAAPIRALRASTAGGDVDTSAAVGRRTIRRRRSRRTNGDNAANSVGSGDEGTEVAERTKRREARRRRRGLQAEATEAEAEADAKDEITEDNVEAIDGWFFGGDDVEGDMEAAGKQKRSRRKARKTTGVELNL